MIIDTHTHFYDPARPEGVPWPPADAGRLYRTVLPDAYRALAEPEGIGGTVVVQASSWLEDNQWILDLAHKDPFIVGFVGYLEAGTPAFSDQLQHYSSDPLFRGIRCNGSYFDGAPSAAFVADMKRLAAHDLSLDVLVRAQQFESLMAVAQAIPQLRIIVNHIGHMPISGESIDDAWQERYARLADLPQIYMKVSALPEQCPQQPAPTDLTTYRPMLNMLWQTFGSHRLIYGSNWPVCERAGDFAVGLNVVKQYLAEKGDVAYDRFFRSNAQAVYKFLARE